MTLSGWKFSAGHDDGWHTQWRDTLARVYLPEPLNCERSDDFYGDVSNIVSPQGIEISRVCAAPQSISGSCPAQPFAMWLSVVMQGRFTLQHNHREVPVSAGDIIFSPTGVPATLKLESDFKMLYVKIPKGLIHPRLLNPSTLALGCLPAHQGINRVFSNLLMTVGETMDSVDIPFLRPVEIALTEFLVTSLAQQSLLNAFGSVAKLVHYQRICQVIDSRLKDPDLSLVMLAQLQNVSPRYIQKLFEAAGGSFGSYVRMRRLERCRCELQNPQYAHVSISDICFRWGFNDAAHFSRSFRNAFGMTPRECRQAALGQMSAEVALA